MIIKSRTGVRLRCRQCRELVVLPGLAPPRSVPPRFPSVEDSGQRLRFRILGLARRRFRCRPSCTSSHLPGQTLRPTSRMTLWAARGRARKAPRRGVLVAALDGKSPRCFSLKSS